MGNNNSAPSSKPVPKKTNGGGSEASGEAKDNNFESVSWSQSNNDSPSTGFEQWVELERGSASDLATAVYEADKTTGDEEEDSETESTYEGRNTEPLPTPTKDENKPGKLKVYKSSDVKIESLVGEGEFGKVWKANLQGKQRLPVAVKTFNAPFDGDNIYGQLNAIMKLKHRNVVTVLGVLDSTNNRQPDFAGGQEVILHYFPEGNLLDYLSKSSNPQDYAALVKLALDVIQGCDYLHSRNVIHGNLAARNILIEKQCGRVLTHYNAKVSDHGIIHLAKAKGCGRNFKQTPNGNILPIRWIPKEILEASSKGFTIASDIWSFGIVLWEILTKGSVPYGKRKEDLEVIELIKSERSPLDVRVPQGYPNEIIDVMKRIFKVNPEERPIFYELRKEFMAICASIKSYEKGGRADSCKDDQNMSAMMKHAGGHDGRRRRRDETGTGRGKRPKDYGCSGGNRAGGGASEKINFLKSTDEPPNTKSTFPNESSKSIESKGRGSSSCNQSKDFNPLRSPKLDRKPLYQGHGQGRSRGGSGNRRGQGPGHYAGPPVSSFHALSSNPSRSFEVVPDFGIPIPERAPPPPYTPNLLPNHSTVIGGGARGGAVQRLPPAPRRQVGESVDYVKEIQKREQELEALKLQKLQHEATETWDKMQSIVSQLTELKAGASASQLQPTGSVGVDMRHRQHDSAYDRSRSNKQSNVPNGGRRGGGRGGRSHSRGKRGEGSKLAPAPMASSKHDNVF